MKRLTESDKNILWKLKSILSSHVDFMEHYNNDSLRMFKDKLNTFFSEYEGYWELFLYQKKSNLISKELAESAQELNQEYQLIREDPSFFKSNFSIYLAFSRIFESAIANFSPFDQWFASLEDLQLDKEKGAST